jgi:hypothetical protein
MVKVVELSGDAISGGTITNFASTGIKDNSTKQSLIVENDKIVVKTAAIESLTGDLTIKGDVKIYGILDAGFIRTTEIIANQRYEKQFIEFAGPTGASPGTGLLWLGGQNRQLVFKADPDRFWLTEHIEIPSDKEFLIEGASVLSRSKLGNTVINSSLKTLGILENLTIDGELNISDYLFFNPISGRFSLGIENANGLFSVYDTTNNVELIIDGGLGGYGKIGTHTTSGLSIVTDNQERINITETGNITIGHEFKDTTLTRIYGKVGIGVKNPKEQLEVAGNMRLGNRLFTNGDAPPNDGNYQKGDIVWNSNPKSERHVGWICLAGGTPGNWKPFGLIAA